jgi:glycine oxidase
VKVTVVGAGVVGCAIAYELARRGAVVRVVDSRSPGQGATRASAGMLAPHIEGHIPALRELGVRSLGLYDDFIGRVRADSAATVEYERSGTVQLAGDVAEASRLAALAHHLAQAGIEHDWLDGRGVREIEPGVSAEVESGLLIPGHGYVAAVPLTQALVAAATRLGVTYETAAVTRVVQTASGTCVQTATGHIESDVAVVAAGSWSPQIDIGAGETGLDPRRDPVVKPVRGQLLHLEAEMRPASRVLWAPGCYAVPWRDGTVLVGATVEDAGFDERATAGGVRGLLNAAVRWLPGLERAALLGVRVGLRPGTGDDLPVVGRSSTFDRVVYAMGHFRNGVLLAPLTASLVAGLVLDGRDAPELALVRPARVGL